MLSGVGVPACCTDNVQGVEMGRVANVQAGESVDESLYEGTGVIYAQSVTATRRGSTTRYGACSCVCS